MQQGNSINDAGASLPVFSRSLTDSDRLKLTGWASGPLSEIFVLNENSLKSISWENKLSVIFVQALQQFRYICQLQFRDTGY